MFRCACATCFDGALLLFLCYHTNVKRTDEKRKPHATILFDTKIYIYFQSHRICCVYIHTVGLDSNSYILVIYGIRMSFLRSQFLLFFSFLPLKKQIRRVSESMEKGILLPFEILHKRKRLNYFYV